MTMTAYARKAGGHSVPTTKSLPTMYDLPYDKNPEEPGLDEFHVWQSVLLGQTFCPPDYVKDRILTAIDLNLYYDPDNTLNYKRPDWFAVLDAPLVPGDDLRLSYVIWQEKVVPFVVVELLSQSTQKEDLGKTIGKSEAPPTKWEVYEQILGIPYYAVYSRHTNVFRAFRLDGGKFREIDLAEKRLWLPEIKLGLGLWHGRFNEKERWWLRWYDAAGDWIPTVKEGKQQALERAEQDKQRALERAEQDKQRALERAEQDKQRALERERKRTEKLITQLRALGVNPE